MCSGLRAALVAQQAAQAATVAASPFSWAFQLVWLASHLCLVALVGSACLTLAVLPVWETLSAGRVRNILFMAATSCRAAVHCLWAGGAVL